MRFGGAVRQVLLAFLLFCTFQPIQAEVLRPKDNLVIEGIPDIPLTLTEAVGRYTEFRTARFLSWQPKTQEMLISTRFGDTPQVHRVKMPGGSREQLTFFPDRVGGASYAPRAGSYFIFSKDTGGNEFAQLYRYDLADGAVSLLTDGKSRNGGAVWSNQGDRIAYSSTRRTGQDTDLYVQDPQDPKSDRLLAALTGGGWGPMDWSPDDQKLLVLEYVSANQSYPWIFDTRTGAKTALVSRSTEQIAYGQGKFSKDNKGIFITTDRGAAFQQLVYLDLATQKMTVLSGQIPWDVEEFDLSPDGKRLVFVTNEDGISKLHLMDAQTRQEFPLPALPLGQISGVQWHPDGTTLGFTLDSARATGDVYTITLASNQVQRWTYSETGGLRTERFSEPRLIRWQSFDQRAISGFLYTPPPRFTGKRPVIINIHGGPESQFQPGFLGRTNYLLNELGVALIYPNVRGSSGYGKTFLTLDNGFLREDSVKDIGALLNWIKTQPDLDSSRIMVTGGSYGGYMTLAVATKYSDQIRCALDVVGISNFVTFLERTEAYRRDLRRVEYGDEREPKMRAFLEAISPLNQAAKIKKPLFVVQGKNDPRVPLQEAEQIVAEVRKQGTPVWYLMAKDEGHGFAKKQNADYQFYATIKFIQEYLLQ